MEVALRGIGDIRDRTDATLWMCGAWPFSSMAMCAVPTPAQIAADTSTYGKNLSTASQAQATQEAQTVITADIAANPQNYGELCPAGWAPDPTSVSGCSACPTGTTPSNGVCVSIPPSSTILFLIGIAVVVFLLVKK